MIDVNINLRQFEKEFNAAINKEKKKIEKAVRAASIETLNEIVKNTVVGNPDYWKDGYGPSWYIGGTLRANWVVGVDETPTEFTDYSDLYAPSADETASKGAQAIKKYDLKGNTSTIYIANNAPYAEFIHSGGSVQPNFKSHWAQSAAERYPQRLNAIVNKVK